MRGAESFEAIQEKVIHFAGRVWQLKDGIIQWLRANPGLKIRTAKHGGTTKPAAEVVEELAKQCLPLMLCADLYNAYKHYDECNRSGYMPYLNGVELDGTSTGCWGIYYNGATKTGDWTVREPLPVPFRIEMCSKSFPAFDFGDAVTVIGQAFLFWVPLIRQFELLSRNAVEDRAILDGLDAFELAVKQSNPFKTKEQVVHLDKLSDAERAMALSNPAQFLAHLEAMHQGAKGMPASGTPERHS